MNAVEHVLLAVMAAHVGDDAAAQHHIEQAGREARAIGRRHRQLTEIAALVVAGQTTRAAGLVFEHTTEFADDAELLARVQDLLPSASALRRPAIIGPRS